MKYTITIKAEDQTMYEQTVDELDMKTVINAVNPTNKRRSRSDIGKKRRFDANEEPAGSIESLV